MRKMKKIALIIIAVLLVICPIYEACVVHVSTSRVNNQNKSDLQGNPNPLVDLPSGVISDMCSQDYWKERSRIGAGTLIATSNEIQAFNNSSFGSAETFMQRLEDIDETYIAKNRIGSIPARAIYINGKLVDNKEYFGNIIGQYEATAYEAGSNRKTWYGICTLRADLLNWPTVDCIGYSEVDVDDENVLSSLVVNEPFAIQQRCTIDGRQYYWGYTDNCYGWVLAECIATCESRDEWLEQWDVSLEGKDFIVVTQDKIVLENSRTTGFASRVQLDMGTMLKLVPQQEKELNLAELAERGTWNNYVVYLPTRKSDGSFERKCALISQHYSVSVGYMLLTESNILDIAFSNIGNRYGWGGALQALDCSLFTRNLYRCFGYKLPRNTSAQKRVLLYTTDISSMTDEEKEKYIEELPIGSLLYFPGHTMVYIGSENNVNYCISATGSVSDSEGALDVHMMNSVIITPLTVRRRTGASWLSDITHVVTFTDYRRDGTDKH